MSPYDRTLVEKARSGDSYQNFDVAIYARVYEVLEMKDLNWLKERFDVMDRQIKVDKVYLDSPPCGRMSLAVIAPGASEIIEYGMYR